MQPMISVHLLNSYLGNSALKMQKIPQRAISKWSDLPLLAGLRSSCPFPTVQCRSQAGALAAGLLPRVLGQGPAWRSAALARLSGSKYLMRDSADDFVIQ